jgi:flavin reductase (DIM6/NTAB) family NADH-FMN oxidoreductase RutF
MEIDTRTFRNICGRFATGVTIVTTRDSEELQGMTVNAFSSLSLEPMLILFCADHRTRTYQAVHESRIFAVNILSVEQQELSDVFAGRTGKDGSERFNNVRFETAVTGAPILADCIGYFDCRVVDELPGGDHTIFVGQVEAAEMFDGEPLLFYAGKYRRMRDEG